MASLALQILICFRLITGSDILGYSGYFTCQPLSHLTTAVVLVLACQRQVEGISVLLFMVICVTSGIVPWHDMPIMGIIMFRKYKSSNIFASV